VTPDVLSFYRETFDWWRASTDDAWARWYKSPLYLESTRVAMDRLLDLRTHTHPLNPTLYEPALRASLKLATQSVMGLAGRLCGITEMPEVAATPHEVIHREDKVKLLRYKPTQPQRYPIPVLLMCSLINRHYILDLTPGRSYVEYLLDQGFDVYMIDWGTPDEADCGLTLEDYINRYIPHALEAVLKDSDADQLSLVGYCMGGMFALMHTALHPQRVKNLILLATPVDFTDAGILGVWADQRYFNVDKLADTFGLIPAELLQWSFVMLKPATNLTKYADLLLQADNKELVRMFLALETWVNDNVPVPGEGYRQFVKATYQDNRLAKNELKIGQQRVDLAKITCSLLNVMATEDHIISPVSASALMELVSSEDKEQLILPYGHIGMTVGSGAVKDLWPKSVAWLKPRSGHDQRSQSRRAGGRKKN
jgi:polyhydroxyalkanoate synthase